MSSHGGCERHVSGPIVRLRCVVSTPHAQSGHRGRLASPQRVPLISKESAMNFDDKLHDLAKAQSTGFSRRTLLGASAAIGAVGIAEMVAPGACAPAPPADTGAAI